MKNDLGKPLTGRAVIYRKEAVEDCLRISVFGLKKAGHFRGLIQQISTACKPYFNIAYQGINDSIGLESTACYFGGVRWWLTCPGCGGRMGVLYKPYYARSFRCRHCYNLAYESTQMRRNSWEPFFQSTKVRHRLIRLLEGVGQKGFSKPELIRLQRIDKGYERLCQKVKGA